MSAPRLTPESDVPNSQSRPTLLSSTLPRRPIQRLPNSNSHPRPQFSPRSSSLNVSAKYNVSTSNLNSPRIGPGSSLRQEVSATPNLSNPLDLLEGVIGRALGESSVEQGDTKHRKTELLVGDVDFGDLSLEEFVSHHDEGSRNQGRHDDGVMAVNAEECEYVGTNDYLICWDLT